MSGGRHSGIVAVAAAVFFVLVARSMIGSPPPEPPAPAPVDASPAYYQSEVVEGPGTAVALLVDTSGSMAENARGDGRPKYVVAREALERVLALTDEFARRRPDYPISIAIIGFASQPWDVLPLQRYDRAAIARALPTVPRPGGGTAIGEALQRGRAALYRSGAFRKYILAITDGQNTVGAAPDRVARDIFAKSRVGVSISFVAFDTDPAQFAFLRDAGGDVVAATDAAGLRQALQQIYEGKILAEAADDGAAAPPAQRAGHDGSTR